MDFQDPVPPVPPVPTVSPVAPVPRTNDKQGLAIASLVVGIINLCAWFLPICGGPLSIVGIVLGVLGLPSTRRGMAIAGIVLSSIALLLSIINAVAGVFLAPMLEELLSTSGY